MVSLPFALNVLEIVTSSSSSPPSSAVETFPVPFALNDRGMEASALARATAIAVALAVAAAMGDARAIDAL